MSSLRVPERPSRAPKPGLLRIPGCMTAWKDDGTGRNVLDLAEAGVPPDVTLGHG